MFPLRPFRRWLKTAVLFARLPSFFILAHASSPVKRLFQNVAPRAKILRTGLDLSDGERLYAFFGWELQWVTAPAAPTLRLDCA